MSNLFKGYKCSFCGFKKDYISAPSLSDIRNVIAANCPECDFGSMIIDLDTESNFDDTFAEKYYNTLIEVFSQGE